MLKGPMKLAKKLGVMAVVLCLMMVCIAGCEREESSESTGSSDGSRDTITSIRMPEAEGTVAYANDSGTIVLDASHMDAGYVMVCYTGDADKVQVQITDPTGVRTPYPWKLGDYEAIPLTGGDGTYQISVLEHVDGTTYSVGLSQTLEVQIGSVNDPYLYPNNYCDYTAESAVVKKGMALSDASTDDLDYITKVYNYVIENIAYDEEFAENIPVNYIPDPDTTLSTKKGICLDYASLTTALLRSQGMPTRLEVGYSGSAYHAWISVWTKETGWIERVIRFDGNTWTLIDPTLAANNDAASVKEYIGDGSNYTLEFVY